MDRLWSVPHEARESGRSSECTAALPQGTHHQTTAYVAIHATQCSVHVHTITDVEAISKFAQWEFKYGDKGRGGTMFESLIASYPRRTDLWCIYSDVLVKAGQLDKAR